MDHKIRMIILGNYRERTPRPLHNKTATKKYIDHNIFYSLSLLSVFVYLVNKLAT